MAGLKGGKGKSKCVSCDSREEQLDESACVAERGVAPTRRDRFKCTRPEHPGHGGCDALHGDSVGLLRHAPLKALPEGQCTLKKQDKTRQERVVPSDELPVAGCRARSSTSAG